MEQWTNLPGAGAKSHQDDPKVAPTLSQSETGRESQTHSVVGERNEKYIA
jgi:hypothetical protein